MNWLAVLIAMAATLWAGFALAFPDYAHRFRLTVEVDTSDGVRGGSSVIEVERRDYGWVPVASPGRGRVFLVRGEGVFLDLGGGRNVVGHPGPRRGRGGLGSGHHALGRGLRRKRWDQDVWSGRTELRGVVELKPTLIPTLVTFADPLDPATVRVVRPGDFEAVFGPGFRFRRAILEMVPTGRWPLGALGLSPGVPFTSGVIDPRLPWLSGMTTNLAGLNYAKSNDICERLGPRSFRRQDP